MDVSKKFLLGFLEGTRQFTLPIFQRRYSWGKKQCEQLWDDVLRVGKDDNTPSYFLGSIVFMPETSAAASKSRVIDGQQRLTTVSLLLSALGRLIEAKDIDVPIDRSRLEGYYLFNEREEGELRYKQLLTKHDKDILIQLLENGTVSDNTSLLSQNYKFFYNELRRTDLGEVYRGIQKLEIVSIALDPQDNPQLIFESLNSKGLDLSQADLIRNYVLMGQEPRFQDRLYETYWYKMERSFGAEYSNRFNLFIRDYLTLKTQQIPGKSKIYESFKRYVGDNSPPEALEAVVNEIYRYSKYYIHIVLHAEPDRELHACFADIRTLGVEVVYPFLLDVYEDYTQQRLNKEEVIEILRLVESYVFRRAICDLPSRDVGKAVLTLIGKIKSGQIDKTDYLEGLKAALMELTHSQRFPSDTEFQDNLLTRDVYNLKTRDYQRGYLLGKFENYNRKEPIRVEDYTIEHIMPQTLTDEWREELGVNWSDVHEKRLHTVGNLTLTGYNPELSNKTFIKKQRAEGDFLDSPLRLNKSLRDVARWDEKAIVNRAEEFVAKACEIWPHHGVTHERQQEAEWTLADHPYFTNEWSKLFLPLQQHILELGGSVKVKERVNRYYISYRKNGTSFLEVHGTKKWFGLFLRVQTASIDDPREMCQAEGKKSGGAAWATWLGIATVGDGSKFKYHYHFGSVAELNEISVDNDLGYIMQLIRQVFEQV